ncbi:MAG: spore germination protein [Clostridiaceae bacterium]|jgi:spore germination protein|nr:spore germination protein [Clostridiaceae bacterium]
MNNFVTNRQISFILYCIIVGYGVINLPKDAAESAGTGCWFPLIISTIILMVMTYIITYLQYLYEGKTLYEYGQKLVGKLITYVFLIICTIYFFTYFSMITRIYGETIRLCILYKASVLYICMLFYIVIFYALMKGINVIARVCEIYGLLNILGFLFINSLLMTKGKLVNIRPLFVTGDLMTYLKSILNFILPFLGIEILFVLPINRTNNKNIFKYTILMAGFIGILYIYIAETTISVIGADAIVYSKAALFSVVRGVDIYSLEFLRRLDGIYIIYWTMNVFCAVCLWGYGTITFTRKIIKNIKYVYIVIAVILIGFIVSQLPKTKDQVESIIKYNSYVGILVFMVIPIILFIITKVKKYDKQV